MSYDHTTVGSASFEAFVCALDAIGVSHQEESGPLPLGATRARRFTSLVGEDLVVEEYLSVDDRDCDGTSRLSTVCYRLGSRPTLFQQVYSDAYPEGDHPGSIVEQDELFEVHDHYVDLATGERHLGHVPDPPLT